MPIYKIKTNPLSSINTNGYKLLNIYVDIKKSKKKYKSYPEVIINVPTWNQYRCMWRRTRGLGSTYVDIKKKSKKKY